MLEENTEVITMCTDIRHLHILEVLYLKVFDTKLNTQVEDLQILQNMRRGVGGHNQSAMSEEAARRIKN